MTELEVIRKGHAATGIETIRRITGKREPAEVIVTALRVYEWMLTQHAKGCMIFSQRTAESSEDRPEIANNLKKKAMCS